MGQEEIIKYLEKEMVSSINEMIEFMNDVSAITVHKAVGKLVKHGEVIRFDIGSRCFYCVPEIKEEFMVVEQ